MDRSLVSPGGANVHPINYTVPWAQKSMYAKLAHDRFIRFCTVHPCEQHRPWNVQHVQQYTASMWYTRCSLIITVKSTYHSTFSALTLLAGHQKEHLAYKNRVMRCWRGYLSGARCRLFAHGLADATASQNPNISWLILIQTGFTFLVPACPGCPGKEAVKRV